MGRINVLPFEVANLIAAGEVVDRPSSVIKELVENAIDAGATRITVEIQNGGVTFMRVSDNGCGMTPEDMPVAILRHATSKIRDALDLEGIMTLGFRGEALAAISSVSDMRIVSKVAGASLGACLSAHYGEVEGISEQGATDGTTVIIENLFGNVPARRKFLKKDVTEAMAVHANVEKVALSHPEIAFRFISDGNVKLETAGDGNLKNTVHGIFGGDFASRLLEVTWENDGIRLSGFIGRTDNFKANRNYENFFINGRFVRSKTATAALEQAFTSYMPPEKFPTCVLNLSINPKRVDVNVHPAKLEVKFSNEKSVFETVYYGVRTALENNRTRPNLQIGLGKKNAFADKISETKVPLDDRRSVSTRQMTVGELAKDSAPTRKTGDAFLHTDAAGYRAMMGYPPVRENEKRTDGVQKRAETAQAAQVKTPDAQTPPSLSRTPIAPATPAVPPIPSEKPEPSAPATAVPSPLPAQDAGGNKEWRYLGEAFRSYLLVEREDKLLLIDKHAAHERILFEELKRNLHEASVTSQMLLVPCEVMVTSGESEALSQYAEELKKVGFDVTFGKNLLTVNAIPAEIDVAAAGDMLVAMAGRILSGTGSVRLTRDILFEKALYQAACKGAIKAGRDYAAGHIEWLLEKLMAIPDITFCPHGRPVAMELTHAQLDKQFDRTGF